MKKLLLLCFCFLPLMAYGSIKVAGGGSGTDATKLPLTGGTMSGDIDMDGNNVTNAGAIGIGTTSPAEALDVQGNIVATGTITSPSFAASGASVISATNTSLSLIPNGSTVTISDDYQITDAGGYIIARSTFCYDINISTDPTTGFNSMNEPLLQVPTGKTYTLTFVSLRSLPAGATVLMNLNEQSTYGSAGTDVLTVEYATATLGGTDDSPGITSFTNATIAGGNHLFLTSPASAGVGGPNRLTIHMEGLIKDE